MAIHVRIAVEPVQHRATPMAVIDWQHADADTIVTRAAACGIVGLGGAGFPSAAKLSVTRDLLILNGAECEPWITCDDRLLREHAHAVLLGGRAMRPPTAPTPAIRSASRRAHFSTPLY